MERYFINGAIAVKTHLFDKVVYHVAGHKLNAIFNGNFGCDSYDLPNEEKIKTDFYLAIFYNGSPLHTCDEKTVYMLGRKQVSVIKWGDNQLKITQFLDKEVNGVFSKVEYQGLGEVKFCLCGGWAFSRFECKDKKAFVRENFVFCSSSVAEYEVDNLALYFDLKNKAVVNCFFSFGETEQFASEAVKDFDKYLLACNAEIENVKLPNNLNEEQKAFFYSCYFCALESYKSYDGYNGFMAGYNYLNEIRTYYRDSYYTVLPMYNGCSDLIREQLLTLSRGVAKDGNCPSAVAYGYEGWWGNHYDSPSFLAIMLYDYVRFTGDLSVLSENIDGATVLDVAESVIRKLSQFADSTKLLFKEGKFNKRDWADAINRYGYVTYDNILYARAIYSLAKINSLLGQSEKTEKYLESYEMVKKAINDMLWDNKLGYYINYKNSDYVEDNLSIDTVWAVIYGIADKTQALSMLDKMEKLLETKNNQEQAGGDFGVMCVYPFYSQPLAGYHKSSLPYCYHNGGNWPYLSATYAYAKKKMGLSYDYPLYSWFVQNVKKGNYTPIEYYSPFQKDGSLLQAWSSMGAFVLFDENCEFFD